MKLIIGNRVRVVKGSETANILHARLDLNSTYTITKTSNSVTQISGVYDNEYSENIAVYTSDLKPANTLRRK